MNRHRFLLMCILCCTVSGLSAFETGIYFSLTHSVQTRAFDSANESTLSTPYLQGIFHLFLSGYRANAFELNVDLYREKSYIPSQGQYIPTIGFGVGLGKLFSIGIPNSRRPVITPDIAFGFYSHFHLLNQKGLGKLYNEGGFYGTARVRVHVNLRFIRTLDIGFKQFLPIWDNLYDEESGKVLNYRNSFFIGISI